ncbi:hypothetical protein [Streptomyces griseicoloratus]|uniref:hypothetical protein n=1 Tax=Streptomyces griseicoloratus TaxID=2752516 RepID=UPI001CB6DD7A|nr:hypothetical protein [Streptomyces griseicoloratus]
MSSETREAGPSTSTAERAEADADAPETAGTADADAGNDAGGEDGKTHPDRTVLIAAVGFLVLCLGVVLFGVLRGGDEDRAEPKAPTASVTYEVTGEGTVDLSYQGASEQGTAETVSGARLPWKKTVEVPLGENPVIRITLGEQGGQARCAVAVRGRHVQSATAAGEFGRATCSAPLPAPAPEASG